MSRQAYALDTLLAEVNKHAPHRSKASDGGLASAAHHKQNPTSDHEPNAADVWTARDFTQDIAGGLSCGEMATLLVRKIGKHPALMAGAYVIWNGRIYSYNRRAEGWRAYTGTNPHTKHLHLSVSDAADGYDSRAPWNLWAKPKPTPVIDDALAGLQRAVDLRSDGPVRDLLVQARDLVLQAQREARS